MKWDELDKYKESIESGEWVKTWIWMYEWMESDPNMWETLKYLWSNQ